MNHNPNPSLCIPIVFRFRFSSYRLQWSWNSSHSNLGGPWMRGRGCQHSHSCLAFTYHSHPFPNWYWHGSAKLSFETCIQFYICGLPNPPAVPLRGGCPYVVLTFWPKNSHQLEAVEAVANPCAWQHRTDFKHCLARDRLLCWKLFISNLFKWINLAVGAKKNSQRLCLWSISLSSPVDNGVSYTRRMFNQLWPNPQSHTTVYKSYLIQKIYVSFFYHHT